MCGARMVKCAYYLPSSPSLSLLSPSPSLSVCPAVFSLRLYRATLAEDLGSDLARVDWEERGAAAFKQPLWEANWASETEEDAMDTSHWKTGHLSWPLPLKGDALPRK